MAELERGNFSFGAKNLIASAGAESLGIEPEYDLAMGFGRRLSRIVKSPERASDMLFGGRELSREEVGAAFVLMGADAEHKGLIERRTGRSPDPRAQGRFVNHLGTAIKYYREAANNGYPVGEWRLKKLENKIGAADFRHAEKGINEMLQGSAEFRNSIIRELRGSNSEPQKQEKGACYIATAVYGSYDAPEVLVLRKYRDEYLGVTALGRFVVRAYYTISPSFARTLTPRNPITKLARMQLDRFVTKLNRTR